MIRKLLSIAALAMVALLPIARVLVAKEEQ